MLCVVVCAAVVSGAGPRFYADDPHWIDDDMSLDPSGVKSIEDNNGYDFVVNTFVKPGEKRDVHALNVNTLDELPDSSWFTNRIGRQAMSTAEIVRGPDRFDRISLDGWIVSGGKSSGLQPGFRMTDPSGHLYQIEFDPPSNPELASAAEIIGTAFYHAFGYHTVDVYLAELDATKLVIAESATLRDLLNGKRRRLTRRDIDDVLKRGARQPNGRYRVLVSRFADGKPLGNFRYYDTRPDDPNDIVPHEHRRELRAARVFGAWLNHDDSRGINSLDMLVAEGGKHYVKHYMFDFGSIMGSGTVFAQRHRAGNEYIFEWEPGWWTLLTAGLYVRPWMLIDYPKVPASVGRFEGDAFDAERWKPEYPNPAFENMRPDDAFWAARIVSRFNDDAIRAVVEKARYTDARATDYVTATLVKRRDKVVKHWLNQVNPVVNAAIDASGTFTFENAAVSAGVAKSGGQYTLQWFRFDNTTDTKTAVGEPATVTEGRTEVPRALLSGSEHIGVTMTAVHGDHPGWSRPATFHFRVKAGAWELVGSEH